MESDESIHFVNSETVNAYAWAVVKEEQKILESFLRRVKMLIHDVFIHTLIFLVKFAILANQAAQKF